MLKGFDFVGYLKRHFFIGQIDPWRRHDNGDPVLCLLTSVETALNECEGWSNQEIGRAEFVKELQSEGIFVFRTIEEFKKYRDKPIEPKLEPKKRNISDAHRRRLQKHAETIRETKIKGDTQNPNNS